MAQTPRSMGRKTRYMLAMLFQTMIYSAIGVLLPMGLVPSSLVPPGFDATPWLFGAIASMVVGIVGLTWLELDGPIEE